jgi:hypothetical protein
MIEIQNKHPRNWEHVLKLLEFGKQIVAICSELDIHPILSGSLAVFGYTQRQEMAVNDIDLACSELAFPRLSLALETHGIAHTLKPWRVLQVHKGALKVEFDSLEHWMAGLPDVYDTFDTLIIDGYTFNVVSLATLRELYRRGLADTANQSDEVNQAKYAAIAGKYEALCSIQG